MHVVVDLNWLLQFAAFASVAAFGIFYFVRTRFFVVVDSNFRSTAADFSRYCNNRERMVASVGGATEVSDSCAVCARVTTKHCAGCKRVKYCSAACQETHWNSGHMTECKETRDRKSMYALRERKISLVPAGWNKKILKQSNKIIFPYEEFVQFFNWEKPGCPPCGLLNCGNSCFANVVLQCLAYTRPLVAYFLEKGHKIECQMDKWCFLCEFQTHVERASQCHTPFAPINILSRLTNIGGSLGYGKQEDAHEFMRFAIDTMQSVCLDEFGGEKAVHPSYQETTLVQHIFGGHLQSQVICTKCNNVSNQFENMMDLTVEIHGDAESLEECLDQFTAKEWLHGDNMYKCDSCNDHVVACKRLAVRRAPNILTIALKRYQSGRFGKLNKRVTFPEMLDLSSYMSELGDGNDVYKLYAVVVHVDMLNASFFGHYICYVKDFSGNWYRIDDSEVSIVDLDKVLSQRAYMLLYSRICARPSCLLPAEMSKKQENENVKIQRADPSLTQPTEDARGEVDFSSCFGQASPLSDVENARRSNKRDANRALLRMPSEGSSAAEKCTFEKESAYDISSITTSEVREENSANPTYIPGYAKCEGNGSASPAAKKSNRVSSAGAKLKPLFPPGFLNKQLQKEFIQRENKLSLEFTERTPGLQLNNNQTNEVVKPYFSSENGNLLKDEEEPHFVLENGKVSTESAACKSVENGDSAHQTACSERTKTNTAGSKATK